MTAVLIVGGYGVFGSKVAERLARHGDVQVILAGRDKEKGQAAARALSRRFPRCPRIDALALDATVADAVDLAALAPCIVIDATGPFQRQGYGLARAAIRAGCHYLDLADARAFVCGIGELDAGARAAGVLLVSGASSVPGLSSAVIAHYAPRLEQLEAIEIGISPGNRFDPGEATTASILGYVGKRLRMRIGGREATVYGWQGLARHTFPEIGPRWMSYADVPDLELLPGLYPRVASVRFRAGLEVAAFHLGLWMLSWLVRAGVIEDASRMARPLLALKRRLAVLGTDRGAMHVTLEGRIGGKTRRIAWHLVAGSGHGPYVPAIASVLLARRLARGGEQRRGAMPCLGLFTLDEFEREVADLDMRCSLAES